MQNVKILVYVESRYKLNRKRVKKAVLSVLEENRFNNKLEISIAIVGDRKMSTLNKKYRNKEGTTNILSFPLSEGDSSHLPTDVTRLGDIVISFPQVIREAAAQELMVDDHIEDLVRHGMMHLLGLHHE